MRFKIENHHSSFLKISRHILKNYLRKIVEKMQSSKFRIRRFCEDWFEIDCEMGLVFWNIANFELIGLGLPALS